MQTAETILGVIRERGRRGLPLEGIYRQLYNPALYLRAYGRLYRNDGAMTPGSTPETVDGMSLAKIEAIIEALRFERYRWTPVRRTYIEKKNSTKLRPLGIPTWSDKLLQEVMRSVLEAYYEPQFSPNSHGFRPGRGCHTALRQVQDTWKGTTWFIEGDITGCFDNIDHEILLSILAERLHDNRFLRLIRHLLRAGYLEDWHYHATLSGTPQGGVVSPILANIYLDRLDQFVETVLLPTYNRGDRRKENHRYRALLREAARWERAGQPGRARALRREAQHTPSIDPTDPDYRRLRYVRYADDFLLGFCGTRTEATTIKRRLQEFLRDHLKLELSEAKTLITHARSDAAHFLGYEVMVMGDDEKRTAGKRSVNGVIGLRVPMNVITAKCAPYMQHDKPIHRPERLHDSDFSIVAQYQAEYRGIVQYYQLAHNIHRLGRLRWVMEVSLAKTLAAKFRTNVTKVYERYQTTIATPNGLRKVLRVVIDRGKEKKPLVAYWGGIPLRRRADAVLTDQPPRVWNVGTELLQRCLADTCELCGSQANVQVHHVKALRALQPQRSGSAPEWVKVMIARNRKTLVVCRRCHQDIHAGCPERHSKRTTDTGEPDLSKGRRPVRRGADGKVPIRTGR